MHDHLHLFFFPFCICPCVQSYGVWAGNEGEGALFHWLTSEQAEGDQVFLLRVSRGIVQWLAANEVQLQWCRRQCEYKWHSQCKYQCKYRSNYHCSTFARQQRSCSSCRGSGFKLKLIFDLSCACSCGCSCSRWHRYRSWWWCFTVWWLSGRHASLQLSCCLSSRGRCSCGCSTCERQRVCRC